MLKDKVLIPNAALIFVGRLEAFKEETLEAYTSYKQKILLFSLILLSSKVRKTV